MIFTGTLLAVVVPSPSSAVSFPPQHHRPVDAEIAQACVRGSLLLSRPNPIETAVQSVRFDMISVGSPPSVVLPLPSTPLSPAPQQYR